MSFIDIINDELQTPYVRSINFSNFNSSFQRNAYRDGALTYFYRLVDDIYLLYLVDRGNSYYGYETITCMVVAEITKTVANVISTADDTVIDIVTPQGIGSDPNKSMPSSGYWAIFGINYNGVVLFNSSTYGVEFISGQQIELPGVIDSSFFSKVQISGDTIAGFRKPWTYTNTLSNEYPIVAYVIKFTVNSVGALSVSTSEYGSIEDTKWAKMWQQRASSDDSRINVNYINILNYLDLVCVLVAGYESHSSGSFSQNYGAVAYYHVSLDADWYYGTPYGNKSVAGIIQNPGQAGYVSQQLVQEIV